MRCEPCVLQVIMRVVEIHFESTRSHDVELCKSRDRLPYRGETIAARRRKIARDAEHIQRFERARGYFGNQRATEELAEAHDQATHHQRLGVAAKIAALLADFADEPHYRHAPTHPVRIDPF